MTVILPHHQGNRRLTRNRRGGVLAIVVWGIALLSIVVAATQIVTFRTAAMGAKNLERVQARWAARAGVEQVIAVLGAEAEDPNTTDAIALTRTLEDVAQGQIETGSWSISHVLEGVEYLGPMDESAKLNINSLVSTDYELLELEGMSLDVIDAIVDWRDEDDEVSLMGAEEDFYLNRNLAYTPRNADVKSLAELELVAGVWPEDLRGGDHRLTNSFDPNETISGWGEYLTAYTYSTGALQTGEPKFRIDGAETEDVAAYFGISNQQATELLEFSTSSENVQLESLIAQNIGGSANSSGLPSRRTGRSSAGSNSDSAMPFTDEQYRVILDEGWIGELTERRPGRINVNTATQKALEVVFSFDPSLAEDVISLRNSRSGGITSIMDLLEAGRITPELLGAVGHRLTTQGTVFSITSRGTSQFGDIETAMFVVVDRSTLPIQIMEYREE
ncbi:MAG: type II secretion system protein GspK [Phycisphaerales bacterium]|nr:type II secretion system protein GspK [Phycisphaerales bacterium]